MKNQKKFGCDMGELTEEEFKRKKEKILGL